MIRSLVLSAAMVSALAGPAAAQSITGNPPAETVLCMDVNGGSLPAVCKVPSSRLDKREDFCLCRVGTKVTAPVCGPGQRPPAENIAFEKARKAAARDGTLIGDLYEGKPMCVAERSTY